jgi:hypothetical protein
VLSIYAFFIAVYVTIYFFGYPVKTLLLNGDLKKYDLYITPWLGVGVIVLVLYPLSWLGFSVKGVTNYFFAAVLLINLAVYFKYREVARFDRGEVILIAVMGFAVSSIFGVILFAHDFEYYGVALNPDFGYYLMVAKVALETSARYIAGAAGEIIDSELMVLTLHHQLRGGVFLLSFLSILYNVEMSHMFYLLMAFSLFLSLITFRLFLKDAGRVCVTCLILGVLCFNTFYQWLVFWCFWGQLLSLGITVLAFYLVFYLTKAERFDPRTGILLVFVLSLNSLNYIEALVYPIVPIIAFSLISLFRRGESGRFFLKNAAFVCAAYAVLNFPVILKFLGVFFEIESISKTWFMHMATLFDIAGLFNAFPNPMSKVVIVAVNCVLLFVIACQLERERFSSFLSVSSGAFLMLYIFFCYLYFKDGDQSTYKSYKAAVSLSFVIVILLLRFLESEMNALADAFAEWRRAHGGKFDPGLFVKLPCKKNLAVAAAFFVIFALNVSGSVNYYLRTMIAGEFPGVSKGHDALKAFAESRNHSDSDFILNCAWSLNQLMAEYHSPFGRTFSNNYLLEEFELNVKDSFKAGDIYVVDDYERDIYKFDAKRLLKNEVYEIFELGEESILFYEYIGNFVRQPTVIRYGNGLIKAQSVAGKNIGFAFISLKPRSRDFYITFHNASNFGAPIKARAFFNGEAIGEFKIDERYKYVKLDGISLINGINRITFELDGDFSNLAVTNLRFSGEEAAQSPE